VRVLNNPVPAPFKESIRCAEQNLYARAQQLVGDRDPRSHEFSVQLRGFDAAKAGAKTGVAALIALSSALLKKSVRGGLVVVGEVTLGGTIEPIHNAVTLAEIAVEKGLPSRCCCPCPAGASCSTCRTRWRPSWTSSFIKMLPLLS
jgi:ATP-dependent Lon protease